jgi:membrane fusion protein (multidrug efflux system)
VRDERVAIIEGVKDGEQIVTTGQLKLNPGAAIRIDNAQAIKPYDQRPKQ